jgi:hypothetical protein
MKILLLLALVAGPHAESGSATLPASGKLTVKFKSIFPAMPQCHASNHAMRTFSREWIELYGKPGQQVAWSCVE